MTTVGYVYKVWKMGKRRNICVRCAIHGYIPVVVGEEEGKEEEGKGEEI
jgi:ribosomal protein S26